MRGAGRKPTVRWRPRSAWGGGVWLRGDVEELVDFIELDRIIRAGAAVEVIEDAVAGEEAVVAVVAVKNVGTVAAGDDVIAGAAVDGVFPGAAVEQVVARAAVDVVAA